MSNSTLNRTLWAMILWCMGVAAYAQPEYVIDKVVAKVGGEYVLLSELEEQFRYNKEQTGTLDDSERCGILETIVVQKLLIDQAKLDSIEISDEEVEAQLTYRIDNILRMMNGDEERFREFYGQSVVQVKDRMREELRQQILAERIQQSLISSVEITPQEVLEFYNNIPQDSLPYLHSEVELREIVVKPKVNDDEKAKARERLEKIRSRIIDGGEDFAQLANTFSDDPGSAQNGGDLGWQKRGTFVADFEAVAYSLEANEISEIVETEFGFHLIQLLERRGNTIHARHVLIRPEITQADLDATRAQLDTLRTSILADSLSFSKAVKRYSDKNAQSYHNNGRMQNPQTGDTFFQTGDLPPEVYFAIESMEVNDISEPLEFTSPTNEAYFRLVQLQTKTRPHRANLAQDYARIATFAKQSKKNEYFFNWIQDKIERTFIEVEPAYQSCENLANWIPAK